MSEKNKEKYNDLGLGNRGTAGTVRALNKNGSFNVKKQNIPFLERLNFYHSLVNMSWLKFFGIIIIGYFIINLFFATLYLSIGLEHLTGILASTKLEGFREAFFFSSQTITTLGYGRVAPVGVLANIVAAVESMLGLLSFALATGLLYGRFSKPSAKIKYSKHAVIAPYQDINGFMFRVINPNENELLEVEVNLTLSMKKNDSELRDFFQLNLERPKVVFLPSVWTVVHPINASSPLHNLSDEDFHKKDVEFIILIRAFDESFSQTVYSRSSYKSTEIKWAQKFVYIIKHEDDGVSVDVSRLDETEAAALN